MFKSITLEDPGNIKEKFTWLFKSQLVISILEKSTVTKTSLTPSQDVLIVGTTLTLQFWVKLLIEKKKQNN